MKTVLSLFDKTGGWSGPYRNAGYDVTEVDIQNWQPIDVNDVDSAETALDMFGSPDIILAAPPCTDFAVSGAQYWKKKDESGQTAKSLQLVYQVKRLIDLFDPTDEEYIAENGSLIWALENPVGRIAELAGLGKAWYFDPCDFAGYLNPGADVIAKLDRIRAKNGEGVTAREVDFVMKWNAYTKKTGLWGNFTKPAIKRIEPVRVCPQGSPLQRKGGKSQATKNFRSATPGGFSKAFFEANR